VYGACHGRLGGAAGARAQALCSALTFVTRPCMMRKWGLLTLSCTDWKRSATRLQVRCRA
jgi:hypothetical protein